MTQRLAALLTSAHAPRWRARYGREFRALLEELPASPAIVANAATSAALSHAPRLCALGALAIAVVALAFAVGSDRRRAPVPAPLTPAQTYGPKGAPSVACVHNDIARHMLAADTGCRNFG